nr:hypothetical protein [Tanacetum cinerariifolium]
MGEDFIISPMDNVYKLVPRDPMSRSTPSKIANKKFVFTKSYFKIRVREKIMSESLNVVKLGNGNIPDLIVTVTHNLSNMIVTKLDGTKKFIDEISELRAVSGHMLGASGVQIPQNNLDNLQSIREEDETLETMDSCKIHVKYWSFHRIRANSPYDTKMGQEGPRQRWTIQDHLVGPSLEYKYPLLALREGWFSFSSH